MLFSACQHIRPIDELILSVPYPSQLPLPGGYCLYGAFLIVSDYLHEQDLNYDSWQKAPYADEGERIAQEYFRLTVKYGVVRFSQMQEQLERGLPVVLLFRGADKGDIAYSDAVVLVGLNQEGVYLHYPVWPFPGSGAFVFVEWNRFYELYTGWGYVICH